MSKDNKEIISVIYQTRNDSPKHIQITKNKLVLFLIALPLVALIGLAFGVIGLIHTSPFHLIENYQINKEAHVALMKANFLKESLKKSQDENLKLKMQIETATTQNQVSPSPTPSQTSANSKNKAEACPPTPICPSPKEFAPMTNSIGLSTLSFFKPIQMQKDKTRPPSMELNGFKTVNNRETVNLQFNIVNLLGGDVKLAGHIIVLMKTDQVIEVYPMNALNSPKEYQINYTAGEPFATQRFRPVDASFPKPKRGGNYIFTVFIFAKNGDLIHYQNITANVKI